MYDLLFLGMFLGSCIATWLFAGLCDRLLPKESRHLKGKP